MTAKASNGIPCCDIADGHRINQSHYWVPIDDKWIQFPDHAVVDNYGNPTGDAVVWYTEFNGSVKLCKLRSLTLSTAECPLVRFICCRVLAMMDASSVVAAG